MSSDTPGNTSLSKGTSWYATDPIISQGEAEVLIDLRSWRSRISQEVWPYKFWEHQDLTSPPALYCRNALANVIRHEEAQLPRNKQSFQQLFGLGFFEERLNAAPDEKDSDLLLLQFREPSDFEEIPSSDVLIEGIAQSSGGGELQRMRICQAELAEFNDEQTDRLLPLLWNYVIQHRFSADRSELTAACAAIRVYLALSDISNIESVVELLQPEQSNLVSLEVELEVVKMVYRKFEANPTTRLLAQNGLSTLLFDRVIAYTNPLVLLRDKFATIASLAIQALVAAKNTQSNAAIDLARDCKFGWFRDIIGDALSDLAEEWKIKDPSAARWVYDNIQRLRASDIRGSLASHTI